MDAGPVIDSEKTPIAEEEDGSSLRKKLGLACIPLLERNLANLFADRASEEPQDDQIASYCRRLSKMDGNLDFSLSAHCLARRVAAFRAWPGCFFEMEGVRIKVGSASAMPAEPDAVPGEILDEVDGCLRLATGKGVLVLRELQRPGGSMLPAPDFLRGFPLPTGTKLPTVSGAPLVAEKPSFFS
jgi:methionyl-tRNA formyltransferase